MFYYTNNELVAVIWGDYVIPEGTKAFIIEGYAQGDSSNSYMASDCVVLFCEAQKDGEGTIGRWTIVAKPGDVIPIANEDIGIITKLHDPGTRVKIVRIV